MDLIGSLVDTNLKIYPTEKLTEFLKTIKECDDLPHNILNYIKANSKEACKSYKDEEIKPVHLTSSDIENIKNIKNIYSRKTEDLNSDVNNITKSDALLGANNNQEIKEDDKSLQDKLDDKVEEYFLVTSDLDWLYSYMKNKRSKGDKNIPYLHTLLEGVNIDLPENETIKRNPVLEARCVKLRAQQEAREYRKMTRGVDNVRMRFPEDSIAYQYTRNHPLPSSEKWGGFLDVVDLKKVSTVIVKHLNRQLIAVGQFIISIFAGFLFGFRGVEWMVGNLDFGFRLLMGVMCALVIALAEIYFLAKKLNEELCVPETVQLGGPPKFAEQEKLYETTKKLVDKEHQD